MSSGGRLAGKRALVTGAGTGIGREIALELGRQGASVALHYSNSRQGADTAVTELAAMGVRAQAVQADLGRVEECFRLVDEAAAFLGGLDVLVNNAGITEIKAFGEVTPEDFDRLYAVNIRGQFFCAQRAVRHMRPQKRGAIVNLTSIHALGGLLGHSVYAGTKGAIVAWTREVGIELAGENIRVNAIAPGWIDVERHHAGAAAGFDADDVAGRQVPRGRAGRPSDVAHLCVYLASDEADFVLGQTYVIDGGTMALMPLRP